MSTETLSQELQQAFEVYKAKNLAELENIFIAADSDGHVDLWTDPFHERFDNQEAAIAFFAGTLLSFRVQRTQIQDESCTVQATSKRTAREFAEKNENSIEWNIDLPLEPQEIGDIFPEEEAAAEDATRARRRAVLLASLKYIDEAGNPINHEKLGDYKVESRGDDGVYRCSGPYEEIEIEEVASAPHALALVLNRKGAVSLFQDIDGILERHTNGDSTAKGDLQLLSAALRLKMALVKFKQVQDDRVKA
jgi:hypothetical protein